MLFFKKRNEELKKRSADFDRRLADANKKIDNLDFKISEYRRKFMTLKMHGRRAQSVRELERMLQEMRMEAADAQAAIAGLQKDHADCVALVDQLVQEFEASIDDIPDD